MFATFAACMALAATLSAQSCSKEEHKLPDVPPVTTFARYSSNLSMSSATLGEQIPYAVFLPADYVQNTDKRYPVVYLLHGFGDDHTSWNDEYLNITSLIEQQEAGGLEPMIYVMPEGFDSYYVNRYDGSFDYMDMFVDELVPYIDQSYRTLADRDHRAVVGYSMGGYGAMILPTEHPETFSVSVPLSMSFRTDAQYMSESQDGWNTQWGSIFGGKGMTGAARLTDYYKAHSPFYLFTPQTAAQYADVHYYYDCGDDEDQLEVANDDLHVQLRDAGIAHEYRVRNGAHTSDYWRSAMVEVLPYLQTCFSGAAYKSEEQPSMPAASDAVVETATWNGTEATVYLPAAYAENPDKSYPVLYYLSDGAGKLPADEVMRMLSSVQKTKPFIMIACDDVSMTDFPAFAAAVESGYRVLPGADHRTALGFEAGGKTLYEASLAAASAFSSLFLIDAAIDASIASPNASVFYYISLADMGDHYAGANALYKYCHGGAAACEYRVYNGTDSENSALVGLQNMRTTLSDKIKTN